MFADGGGPWSGLLVDDGVHPPADPSKVAAPDTVPSPDAVPSAAIWNDAPAWSSHWAP